ncbi:Protein of unknown function [Amycolatopsis xylanica]|uniref:DUF998 domain-containing protein n=1 Tax=Amycolatopsis xylanica TaxID=589385 RepID=A0A1H3JPN4_9PSEU|nr:DUF998 domain-containing protein [Amycolatopsis xylanica]SDY41328.1 Protein of unknown function [Amycolatopsis xylanica]
MIRQVAKRASVLPLLGLFAGAVIVLLLQVLPPSNAISPIRRTISEYALGPNKWLFDTAVVVIALASAAGFAGLIRARRLPSRSAATVFSGLWVGALLLIIIFPKHNWAVGPSAGGTVHRVASVVAFVCLPIAVLLAARTVFPRSPGRRRLSQALAVGALLWFAVILGAIAYSATGAGPWWTLIPLGLVERLMALTGLLAIGTLIAPIRLDMTHTTVTPGELTVPS